jgi:hypothetical protein
LIDTSPRFEVFGTHAADGDHAAVVGVPRLAGDRPLANAVGQRERRLLAAATRLAGGLARLPPLRRIDIKQRMRWPWISSVSPSMTDAQPARSAAAAQTDQHSAVAKGDPNHGRTPCSRLLFEDPRRDRAPAG